MSPEKKFLFQRLFGDKIPDLKDLPEESLQRQLGQINESFFTEGVDILRNNPPFPNKHINELMSLFWELVGNKITRSAMASGIKTLIFYAEQKGIESIGIVIVPRDFYLKFGADPYMQLGALTFTASQAKDFYNQKLADRKAVLQRAYAYEAEYLNTVKQVDSDFTPNDYQAEVLNKYPKGLMSLAPNVQYISTPFIKPIMT